MAKLEWHGSGWGLEHLRVGGCGCTAPRWAPLDLADEGGSDGSTKIPRQAKAQAFPPHGSCLPTSLVFCGLRNPIRHFPEELSPRGTHPLMTHEGHESLIDSSP